MRAYIKSISLCLFVFACVSCDEIFQDKSYDGEWYLKNMTEDKLYITVTEGDSNVELADEVLYPEDSLQIASARTTNIDPIPRFSYIRYGIKHPDRLTVIISSKDGEQLKKWVYGATDYTYRYVYDEKYWSKYVLDISQKVVWTFDITDKDLE